MIHPYSDQVVTYPDPLDDPEAVNSEVLLLWARRTVLYLEIELLEKEISDYDQKKSKGEEEIFEWETAQYEQALNSLREAKKEKEIV